MVRLRRSRLRSLKEEDLDDLVQDVVLLVWRNLHRYDGVGAFEGWVWGFVLRLSYKAVERKTRSLASEVNPELEDARLTAEACPLERQEAEQLVHAAVNSLGEPLATIVRKRAYDHVEFADLAATLGLAVGTIKSRYYRALRQLAPRLAGLQSSDGLPRDSDPQGRALPAPDSSSS